MTICLAIACDCNIEKTLPKIIMVGDRMLTVDSLNIEFEYPKTKLVQLTKNCVIATAGNALAITELQDIVRQKLKTIKHTPQIHDIAVALKETYISLRGRDIEDNILKPIGINTLETFYQSQQNMNPGISLDLLKKIRKYLL
jgi:hypothetical protein